MNQDVTLRIGLFTRADENKSRTCMRGCDDVSYIDWVACDDVLDPAQPMICGNGYFIGCLVIPCHDDNGTRIPNLPEM